MGSGNIISSQLACMPKQFRFRGGSALFDFPLFDDLDYMKIVKATMKKAITASTKYPTRNGPTNISSHLSMPENNCIIGVIRSSTSVLTNSPS